MGTVLIGEYPRKSPMPRNKVRVVVDSATRTVTFSRCHRRRSFWAFFPERERVCSFADVLAVHDLTSRGGYQVVVVTRFGAATLYGGMVHLDAVRDALAATCVNSAGGPVLEGLRAQYCLAFAGACILGGLVSWLGLWWATGEWALGLWPLLPCFFGLAVVALLLGWWNGYFTGRSTI